jgi:hypothetical protein
MKLIDGEGSKLYYFTKDEILDETKLQGIDLGDNYGIDYSLFPIGLDYRLILTKIMRESPFFFYYLYWCDGTDLEVLDEKVKADTYTDQDFEYAIMVRQGKKWCVNGHIWECLETDGPMAWFGKSEVMKKKNEIWLSLKMYNCPACGGSFRQSIIKTFDVCTLNDGFDPAGFRDFAQKYLKG